MFNLARSLDRNADRTPDEDAVIFRDTRLTHRQLLDRVNALAAAFRAAGVGRGDIVALLMGNRPEFLESALAVNRVGAAFLPLNVRLAEPELEYIIRHAGRDRDRDRARAGRAGRRHQRPAGRPRGRW